MDKNELIDRLYKYIKNHRIIHNHDSYEVKLMEAALKILTGKGVN